MSGPIYYIFSRHDPPARFPAANLPDTNARPDVAPRQNAGGRVSSRAPAPFLERFLQAGPAGGGAGDPAGHGATVRGRWCTCHASVDATRAETVSATVHDGAHTPTQYVHLRCGRWSMLVNGRNIPIAVISFACDSSGQTARAARGLSPPRYLYRASLFGNGNSLDTPRAPDTISAVFWLKTLFRRRAA